MPQRRPGAPGLPGGLRRAEHLHRAGRAHPDARLRGERVHHRPAGAELAATEAPHPARELRPGDGHGGRGLDSGARSARGMPRLGGVTPRRWRPSPCWRLPAHGGAAGWLRGGLRGDEAALAVSSPHARAARGGHLLRARRREGQPRRLGPCQPLSDCPRFAEPNSPVGLSLVDAGLVPGQSRRPEHRAHRPRPRHGRARSAADLPPRPAIRPANTAHAPVAGGERASIPASALPSFLDSRTIGFYSGSSASAPGRPFRSRRMAAAPRRDPGPHRWSRALASLRSSPSRARARRSSWSAFPTGRP